MREPDDDETVHVGIQGVLFVLQAFLIGMVVGTCADAFATPGATDRMVRPPLPPLLPPAGGAFIDPSFGTTLIRVTDERDGTRCNHAYSYWPAFNADATRLLIACDDVPRLYRFDPASGKVTPDGKLTGADGPPLQFDGASWSHDYPTTLYALSKDGTKLWRLNVAKRGRAGYELLRDFAAGLPGRALRQLTVSDGGTVFAFSVTGGGMPAEAAVWRRGEDVVRVFERPPDETVNEIQIAKTGTRAVVHYDSGRADLWDLAADEVVVLPNSTGHFDNGRALVANGDGILTGVQVRGYGLAALAPHNVLRYLRPNGRPNWSLAEHVSLRADDEATLMLSTYGGDKTWAPFEDEIVLVRTDGSGFLRLAHTYSAESAPKPLRYFSQPRATVDRSGRWITFTSDLGSTTRTDVLLVRVP